MDCVQSRIVLKAFDKLFAPALKAGAKRPDDEKVIGFMEGLIEMASVFASFGYGERAMYKVFGRMKFIVNVFGETGKEFCMLFAKLGWAISNGHGCVTDLTVEGVWNEIEEWAEDKRGSNDETLTQ